MNEIRFSTRFKKDIKRYEHDDEKLKHLYDIVSFLQNDISIPAQYLPHRLKGEYKGLMECHIENDYLLIWRDPVNSIIWLERLGSHSELFGKKRKITDILVPQVYVTCGIFYFRYLLFMLLGQSEMLNKKNKSIGFQR